MPNQQIERSLSDLAITALGDQLPGLMEYLLGFELVSTGGAGENSGTRAAGLLGFDIGGEQIMMPVLFLNGQLKGNNCLYLKSSDTFVSASPEWVEYLTSRSTGNPGEPDPRGRKVQGVPSQSLRIFNQPPQISNGKYASKEAELADIFEEFMNPAKAMAPNSPTFTVPNLLKDMGKRACAGFMQHLLQDFPELLVKMAQFYPGDELKVAFEDEVKQERVTSVKEKKLAFATLDSIYENPTAYTGEQKEAAFRGELIVIDKRAKEEKSETFSNDYAERFSSPTESGFYKMLNAYGELKDVFIGYNSFLLDKPGKSVNGCTIIDPKSGTYYLPIENEEVLVCPKKALSDEEFDKGFKKLTKIESAVMNKTYVAVSPKGQVSAPFEVRSKDKTPNYQALRVDTLYAFESRMNGKRDCSLCSSNSIRGTTVRIVDANLGKVTRLGDVIAVPSDWRIMEVDKDQDLYSVPCCASEYDQKSEDEKRNAKEKKQLDLKPGNLSVLTQAIQDNNLKELSVEKKASDYMIVLGKGKLSKCAYPMKKNAALATLIGRFGMDASEATELVTKATEAGSSHLWIKMADIYNGMPFPSYDDQGGVNEMGVPEQYTQTEQVPIPMNNPEVPDSTELDRGHYDRIQQQDVDFLSRAADSNSKSVFDPHMIGQILKTQRVPAMIDRWLPDLVKAMDSAARMSILYYWSNGKFSELYGADELSSLEDLLLENLLQLGKICLFMKQRATEGSSTQTEATGEK